MPPVHRKVKLMGLWLDSEGIMINPSANDVISMALDALLEGVYPKAKGFVNKCLQKSRKGVYLWCSKI